MIKEPVRIDAQPLELSLKTTFRHAGATRNKGESIWVKASRKGFTGFGEGCPRDYVAGDDLESSLQWIHENFAKQECPVNSFADLEIWVGKNSNLINQYPSAWCAIEIALLDLFSRENNCSVEELLGLADRKRGGHYTAVLGDDQRWKYTTLVDQYVVRGFTDFKIKVSGSLEKDQARLDILRDLCRQHNVSKIRIRLDANNLWAGQPEEAIDYLKSIKGPVFAVEEPGSADDAAEVSRISVATGLPVILDESLCVLDELSNYKDLPGKFIANIKVSRVGGVIRALKFIEEIKKLGWPIIIGCHVGETSLLTRTALIPAGAAGKHLIAQEGAFGDHLVNREPVEPVLKFGCNGFLDLDQPYYVATPQGLNIVPVKNWETGTGLKCRMPRVPDDGRPSVDVLEMPDKYKIHYRTWGKHEGEDALLILHGGMSHSGWQAPLALAMQSSSPAISVVASDRRGCGLNSARGDLGSVWGVIDDITQQVKFLKSSFDRVHLAGWCQGAQYASIAALNTESDISSLTLLTPGFFWNERFRSVISVTEKIVLNMMSKFKLKPDRDKAYVPIPMEPTDFTLEEEWLDFIENDAFKTETITMKSVNIMDEIQEMSWAAIPEVKLPMLVILAEKDRLVDNNKVRQFMGYAGHKFTENSGNRMKTFDCGHAIQFEKPGEISDELCRFILDHLGSDKKKIYAA